MNFRNKYFKGKKREKKRGRLFAAAAAVLVMGTLAGCGKSGEIKEPAVARGRFMESEIALPDEVKDMPLITCMQDADDHFVFYFYNGGSEAISCSYDGKEWNKNETVLQTPDGIDLSDVLMGRDGKLYLFGYDESYTFHLYRVLESGGTEELFADAFKAPEGEKYGPIPDYANILKDGSLLLSTISEARIIAPDGKGIMTLPQEFIGMDRRKPAYAGDDFYLTLLGSKVLRYNTVTGEENGSYGIPEETSEKMMNMILFEDADGGIYTAGPSGLYHTAKDGTIWEQLIDGSLNSMNRQDLYINHFFKVNEKEYYGIYTKADEGTAVFLRFAFDDTVETVPPETVSVYALRDNRTVRQAAAVLQKNNPNIRVDFRIAVMDEEEPVTEDVIRALNTELLNGKGADVLILDGLPAASYRQKGILMDMTEIENSLREELIPNVPGKFAGDDGKTYYLPARLRIPVMFGAPEALEARTSLDKMASYGGEPPLFTADIYENILRQTSYTCYGEIFKQDGTVSPEALGKYLTAIKAAGDRDGVKTEYSEREMKQFNVNNSVLPDGFGRQDAYDLSQGKCAAAVEVLSSIDSAMLPVAAADQLGYRLQDVNGIYLPDTLVGINASASDKEGAEEFVRTLFGKAVQDESMWNGFSVRRDSLDKWRAMEKDAMVSISSQNSEASLEGAWPVRERRDEIIDLVLKAETPVTVDQSVMQMIVDGSRNYLEGKETVEGAVSAIESKIGLYMAEKE